MTFVDGDSREASAFPLTSHEDSVRRWWLPRFERFLPLLLLALATVLSVVPPDQTWRDRGETLAFAAATALVVLLTDTLLPSRWRRPWVQAVAFAALVTSAALLMLVDVVFLAFMIAGFFRAVVLRPWPLVLLGLATTSVLINSLPGGGPIQALRDWPYVFVVIVVVQTVAIGGGFVMSQRLVEQNEQRRRAVAELEAALEENAGLHRQLLTQAREAGMLDERQRLSREIHDTLAQGFAGIITQLEAARQARDDPAAWQRHVGTAIDLARENLRQARRSVHALSPGELDGVGLPDALAGVVRRWADRTGVPAEFVTTGTARPLHPEIEATLLRVTQEALANVDQHARARRVGLTLSYMEDVVTLDVRDDGVGFDADATRRGAEGQRGYGLPGMRGRVRRLAGALAVESEPGAGTAISATVPAIAPVGLP